MKKYTRRRLISPQFRTPGLRMPEVCLHAAGSFDDRINANGVLKWFDESILTGASTTAMMRTAKEMSMRVEFSIVNSPRGM